MAIRNRMGTPDAVVHTIKWFPTRLSSANLVVDRTLPHDIYIGTNSRYHIPPTMSLPFDLIDYICQQLSMRDLTRVSTSNSDLCAIAQKILFRDLHISGPSLPLILTLATVPHLGRHVRSLKIVVGSSCVVPTIYHRALRTALCHMRDVVFVSISLPAPYNSTVILPQNPDSAYEHLQTIHVSLSLDTRFANFLRHVPRLLHLTVDKHPSTTPPTINIPRNALPNLQAYWGSVNGAIAIAPGRPLHSIFLTSGVLTIDVLPVIASASACITTLDATISSLALPFLRMLASAMPRLVNLRVATTYDLWDIVLDAVRTRSYSQLCKTSRIRHIRNSYPKSRSPSDPCHNSCQLIFLVRDGGGIRATSMCSLVDRVYRRPT